MREFEISDSLLRSGYRLGHVMRTLGLIVCAALLPLPVAAATVFNDKAAWEAAMGAAPLTQEDFLIPDGGNGGQLTIVTDTGIVSTAQGIATPSGTLVNNTGGGSYNGLVGDDIFSEFGFFDFASKIVWDLPSAVSGFGFFVDDTQGGVPLLGISFGLGNTLGLAGILSESGTGGPTFFGYIGDSPFDQIGFQGGGVPTAFQISDMQYGLLPEHQPPAVVPLPAGLPLLVAGLACLATLGRGAWARRWHS